LYGEPGSQNGFDNSGHKISGPSHINTRLAARHHSRTDSCGSGNDHRQICPAAIQDVVVAIGLLNEPLSSELNFDELKQFYRDGFGQVSSSQRYARRFA
jgi:glucan 1,3-beta-glucosidase